jgi:hypothetical protein
MFCCGIAQPLPEESKQRMSLMLGLFIGSCYLCDKSKNNTMGKACSTNCRDVNVLLAKLEEKNHLQDLDIEERIVLKWISHKCLRVDYCSSGDFSELRNESKDYIYFGKFLDYLRQPLSSQEEFCSRELASQTVGWSVTQSVSQLHYFLSGYDNKIVPNFISLITETLHPFINRGAIWRTVPFKRR